MKIDDIEWEPVPEWFTFVPAEGMAPIIIQRSSITHINWVDFGKDSYSSVNAGGTFMRIPRRFRVIAQIKDVAISPVLFSGVTEHVLYWENKND